MNRLTTADVRMWMRSLLGDTFTTYYINKANKNKQPNDKKLGCYYTKNSLPKLYEVMGGYGTDRTDYFTLLIVGTDDFEESLEMAEKVFEELIKESSKEKLTINNIDIDNIQITTQIEDVSDFENIGLYEFVINFKVVYQH